VKRGQKTPVVFRIHNPGLRRKVELLAAAESKRTGYSIGATDIAEKALTEYFAVYHGAVKRNETVNELISALEQLHFWLNTSGTSQSPDELKKLNLRATERLNAILQNAKRRLA
jgi:hypothetical protein